MRQKRGYYRGTMWPLDEDSLDTLQRLRATYAALAEAGDEGAMRIVAVVEEMTAEVEDWLKRAASRVSESD